MAKKRKNPFEIDTMSDDFWRVGEPMVPEIPGIDPAELASLMPLAAGMDDHEGMMLFTLLGHLVESGVTPEKYAAFYNTYQQISKLYGQAASAKKSKTSKGAGKSTKKSKQDNRTLLLKIQMKGVVKPPMWREVEVPADRTFLDLHDIIQCVIGLGNGHLWRFGDSAYHGDIVIGIKSRGDYDMGLDYVTADAATTPVSRYLGHVGDTLEYLYDFGDSWLFTVTVKKVLDEKIDHPVCTAYKSELNAIEDTGGPWRYVEMRHSLDEWDRMSEEDRDDAAERACWEDTEEYHKMLKNSVFNLNEVNARLKGY